MRRTFLRVTAVTTHLAVAERISTLIFCVFLKITGNFTAFGANRTLSRKLWLKKILKKCNPERLPAGNTAQNILLTSRLHNISKTFVFAEE